MGVQIPSARFLGEKGLLWYAPDQQQEARDIWHQRKPQLRSVVEVDLPGPTLKYALTETGVKKYFYFYFLNAVEK